MAFEVQGSTAGWLPADVQATFCATLIDQWLLLGLRHAVVCPGSRSTPLAVQLAARVEVDLHIVHDERSAAFVALGIGLATGTPAVALCTSGTAATHFHAAVVEADLSNVALIVITADRPPELHGVGAPQTIDQTRLFGIAPRWFHDPGVAAAEAKSSWRSVATSAWRAATGAACAPGPVHLNLPFREPLLGVVGELPAAGVDAGLDAAGDAGGERRASITGIAWPTRPTAVAITDLAMQSSGRRGLLIVGRGVDDPAAVHLLARALGWPIVADPRSGCRSLSMAIAAFDSLVRDARFAADHVPELVIRLGEPPASKVLAQWLVATAAVQVQVEATAVTGRVIDPDHVVARRFVGPIGEFCALLTAELTSGATGGATSGATSGATIGQPSRSPEWVAGWLRAEAQAQAAISAVISDDSMCEPAVSRLLTSAAVRPGTHLVVASSMPIRDVEWFGSNGEGVTVHSNRGANGIDGVISTGIGVALGSARPTVVLLGDIAMCHDSSSLTALARRHLDLAIVVVDNDGGAIFSFLPQATALSDEQFEQLFGTPHGTDIVALAAAHGLPAVTVESPAELLAAVHRNGPCVVRVASDRAANVACHGRLHAAVAAAVSVPASMAPPVRVPVQVQVQGD